MKRALVRRVVVLMISSNGVVDSSAESKKPPYSSDAMASCKQANTAATANESLTILKISVAAASKYFNEIKNELLLRRS